MSSILTSSTSDDPDEGAGSLPLRRADDPVRTGGKARQADALRANLRRRKAQSLARGDEGVPTRLVEQILRQGT